MDAKKCPICKEIYFGDKCAKCKESDKTVDDLMNIFGMKKDDK